MTIKKANTTKKKLPCLRCGRRMWTDRCHRICGRCKRRNMDEPVRMPVSVRLLNGEDGVETLGSRPSYSRRAQKSSTQRLLKLL